MKSDFIRGAVFSNSIVLVSRLQSQVVVRAHTFAGFKKRVGERQGHNRGYSQDEIGEEDSLLVVRIVCGHVGQSGSWRGGASDIPGGVSAKVHFQGVCLRD